MKTVSSATCPVSAERVNENVVRTIAAAVIVLAGISVLLHNYVLLLFLAADFALRAFTPGNWSLLRMLAVQLVRRFRLAARPVDAAPKRFAAGVGLVFALAAAAALFFGWDIAAYAILGVLLVCALLEAVFAFCVGCVVYTWLHQLMRTFQPKNR
jgi:hypothetical protein